MISIQNLHHGLRNREVTPCKYNTTTQNDLLSTSSEGNENTGLASNFTPQLRGPGDFQRDNLYYPNNMNSYQQQQQLVSSGGMGILHTNSSQGNFLQQSTASANYEFKPSQFFNSQANLLGNS